MADLNTGAGSSRSDSSEESKARSRGGSETGTDLRGPDVMLSIWTSWMERLSTSPQIPENLDWPNSGILPGSPGSAMFGGNSKQLRV